MHKSITEVVHVGFDSRLLANASSMILHVTKHTIQLFVNLLLLSSTTRHESLAMSVVGCCVQSVLLATAIVFNIQVSV